jgi:hypothetical protein
MLPRQLILLLLISLALLDIVITHGVDLALLPEIETAFLQDFLP